MKKRTAVCIGFVIFVLVSPLTVSAQNVAHTVSPEYSRAIEDTADFIINTVRARRGAGSFTYLNIDFYTLNDQRTGFGSLLASSLSAKITERGGSSVGVIASDYLPLLRRGNPDYQLPETDIIVGGRIFKLTEKLLIQTVLIDPARGILIANHETTIELTPELFALLASSESGAVADLFEPDGTDNPTIVTGEFQGNNHTLTSGDEDWYEYRSDRDGLVTFGTGGSLDTIISVYGPDDRFTTIAYNDDSENSENAKVTIMTESGKTYYFQIVGYEGEQSGSYTTYLTFEEMNDPDEPNNSITDAVNFPAGRGRLETRFFPQNDIDWFKITVPDRGTSGIPISIETHSAIDPEITLYDSGNTVVGTSDDDGTDYNALLNATVQPGQTYYLRVSEIDGSTGPYALSITGME